MEARRCRRASPARGPVSREQPSESHRQTRAAAESRCGRWTVRVVPGAGRSAERGNRRPAGAAPGHAANHESRGPEACGCRKSAVVDLEKDERMPSSEGSSVSMMRATIRAACGAPHAGLLRAFQERSSGVLLAAARQQRQLTQQLLRTVAGLMPVQLGLGSARRLQRPQPHLLHLPPPPPPPPYRCIYR